MRVETAAEIAALPSMQALPLKRRFFALSYVRSSNGSDAAREAGYAPDKRPEAKGGQLSGTAGRLLRDASVALAVREGQAIFWRSLAMGPDEVIARIARIARHDHRKVIDSTDLGSLDDDTAEALSGIKRREEIDKNGDVKARTVEVKIASKLQALEMLAKYHRLLQPDATAGDFGSAFADAMERAGNRAALRATASTAEDAVIVASDRPSDLPSSAVEDFAHGSERT